MTTAGCLTYSTASRELRDLGAAHDLRHAVAQLRPWNRSNTRGSAQRGLTDLEHAHVLRRPAAVRYAPACAHNACTAFSRSHEADVPDRRVTHCSHRLLVLRAAGWSSIRLAATDRTGRGSHAWLHGVSRWGTSPPSSTAQQLHSANLKGWSLLGALS